MAQRLTPKVRELVARDRNSRPPVGRLTRAQVEVLGEVARGGAAYDEPVDPPAALTALSVGAGADDAARVLRAVLIDRKAPRASRISAARGLARIASPDAEQGLLGLTRERDPQVRQVVFVALGAFAGPDAFHQLVRLAQPDEAAVARQLRFALALIAHRHDLEGDFLQDVEGAPRRQSRTVAHARFEMRVLTAKSTTRSLARFRGATYGIEFAERAFGLRCGPAEWAMFLNAELGTSPRVLRRLFDRRWVLGVLGQWLPGREALLGRYAVLSSPSDAAARLDIVRADGTTVYTGVARATRGPIAFSIRDVDRPGTAPTSIDGEVTSRGVALSRVVAAESRIAVREALPVLEGRSR